MRPSERLTQLLTDKFFEHEAVQYAFMSCKEVGSNLMILTNKKTLQIPVDRFENFYQKVCANCVDSRIGKPAFVPTELPLKAEVSKIVVVPEMPGVFGKINQSFDALISAIDTATDDELKTLETKAKMLTSVAQTAVNMENSRISLIKLFNGK